MPVHAAKNVLCTYYVNQDDQSDVITKCYHQGQAVAPLITRDGRTYLHDPLQDRTEANCGDCHPRKAHVHP